MKLARVVAVVAAACAALNGLWGAVSIPVATTRHDCHWRADCHIHDGPWGTR